MGIKLVDLTRQSKKINTAIINNIKNIINSGDFILGKELKKFEKDFAKFITAKYCIGVASGTDAILMSLEALGVGPEDEIIVPAMTFIASVSPILKLGAKPVFVDILPNGSCINPALIEMRITKKTKAIIPVHLYGFPCEMDKIMNIAKKHKLFVIEDACQAHGSLYKGKKIGSFGNAATFSFYPAKNLGAYGDGGAIITSDKNLYDKILMLRNHGQKQKYKHQILGHNSRLDTLQAAVLRIKLKNLDKWNKKRRTLVNTYENLLKKLPITLLTERDDVETNYHLFVIKTKARNALYAYLKKKNISCGIHYPIPLHLQPSLKILGYKKGDFPNAEELAKSCLSLPIFPELTIHEVKFISNQVRNFFEQNSSLSQS